MSSTPKQSALRSAVLFAVLVGACTSPHSAPPSNASAPTASAAPPVVDAAIDSGEAAEAGTDATTISVSDAGVADTGAKAGRHPRFPKLILAPATQNFACNNYVNCFDDEHGRCAHERDGGSFDSSWTERTRKAADGSPTACCYLTTMCKRPLPQSF